MSNRGLTRVVWPIICPSCGGEGEYDAPTGYALGPERLEQEFGKFMCEMCGGYDRDDEDGWETVKGEGVLSEVTCCICDTVMGEGSEVWEDEAGSFLCNLCAAGDD